MKYTEIVSYRHRLNGVDPRLIAAIMLASRTYYVKTQHELRITSGIRTREQQVELVRQKKSQTLNSKHLTGEAVDVCIMVDGKPNWDIENYREFSKHVLKAANYLSIQITWGGDWTTLVDGPHFQIENHF